MDAFSKPITQKSFRDGHGKNPYLTSADQLPDTIALITFNINDLGLTTTFSNDYATYTNYYSLSESGGNLVADDIHSKTIAGLKTEFQKRGVVLLTPEEYLNTPEKQAYYYNEFVPAVSKVGKFLSNIENRATDISVCADGYRYFDMGAAFDYLRSESLGAELAQALGVDGVLSVGIEIQSQKKEGYLRAIKMTLHATNPNPKEDKKYIGQKTGTGYYEGQLFAGGGLRFKKPFEVMELGKNQIISMDFEGIDVIFNCFIEKFYDEIDAAINKAS